MKARFYDNLISLTTSLRSLYTNILYKSEDIPKATILSGKIPETSDLIEAVKAKNISLVNLLLKSGVDVNFSGWYGSSAIFFACMNGDFDITNSLIKHGADINQRKISIFEEPKITDVLAYSKCIYKYHGNNPLIESILANQYQISELLLLNGTNVNSKGDLNLTPLFFAVGIDNKKNFIKLLISNNADIYIKNSSGKTAFEMIEDKTKMEQLRPYFDLANAIDHLVAGKDTKTEEDKIRLASIEDKELLEVAASRFKVALMSKLTDLPKISQKYLKTKFAFEKLKEIQKELNDEQLDKFFYKILNEPTKFNKQEELAAKCMLEEIAQLESVLLTAKIYRAAGENEKKILTYDTLRTALEFKEKTGQTGLGIVDASGTNTSKDSTEIKAYKEMLAIYNENPNYKKVGYLLQEAISNLAELKKTFAILTGEDKAVFAAHLSNLLAKEPEIFLDEAKEALCKVCVGIDITHATLDKFTEHHDAHEPSATDHNAEDHNPADNIQLAGSAAGVGFAADNHY